MRKMFSLRSRLRHWLRDVYGVNGNRITFKIEEKLPQPHVIAVINGNQRLLETANLEPLDFVIKSHFDQDDVTTIRFDISHKTLVDEIVKNFGKGLTDYRLNCLEDNPNKEKKYVIEYSSPNIAKPFHAGHLRSTIIGHFIANLKLYLHQKVHRLNYLGDWGTQFGILCYGYKLLGDENQINENPLKHLLHVYVESSKLCEEDEKHREASKNLFVQLESGESQEMHQLWQKFREISFQEYQRVFSELGVKFDEFHGESMYSQSCRELVEKFEKMGKINYDNGAKVFVFDEKVDQFSFIPLIKKDGSTLYLTRDIAAAIDRKRRYDFDQMIYVVDQAQSQHFKCLKKILQETGHEWHKNLIHISLGRIQGMSTRKGTIVLLEDLIRELKLRTYESTRATKTTKISEEEMDETTKILGLSALFVNDLKHRRRTAYKFDWDKILSFKGETGIGLQYCHARLCSLERKCGIDVDSNADLNLDSISGEHWIRLFHVMTDFEDALRSADEQFEPHIFLRFTFDLSHSVNNCFLRSRVKDEPIDVARTRLLMFVCARKLLAECLKIIGLTPLNRM